MANQSPHDELTAYFEAANYCVQLTDRRYITFKTGTYNAVADSRLIEVAGVESCWAIVTPYNPGAARSSEADNRARLKRMGEDIDAADLHRLPAINRDPKGQWPDEHGYCIIDVPMNFVENLGRKYDQAAVVTGRPGEAPELVWL